MSVKFVLTLATLVGLAACGGGGGGGVVVPNSPQPTLIPLAAEGSYNGLRNTEATVLNRFYNLNGNPIRTPDAQMPMPTLGSVTYTGMAAFPTRNRTTTVITYDNNTTIRRPAPQIAARATMVADFANGNVSGTIDQFRDRADTALPGSLTLNAAPITGNTYARTTLSGTYPVNGTEQQITGVQHSGRFLGPDACGIEGTIGFFVPRAEGGEQLINGTLFVGR